MKVQRRRRRENKTNYLKRLKMLKSEKPRLVLRKSNKYLQVQYVISKEAQDYVKKEFSSKMLLQYGWPKGKEGSLKSVCASYLTGFLVAKTLLKEKKETPIIDFGMMQTLHKTRIFSFLKGIIDGGINLSCQEEAFPEEDRIKGKNLKEDFSSEFEKIKSKIEEK
jgi:large subunit ribosomal protein L18